MAQVYPLRLCTHSRPCFGNQIARIRRLFGNKALTHTLLSFRKVTDNRTVNAITNIQFRNLIKTFNYIPRSN